MIDPSGKFSLGSAISAVNNITNLVATAQASYDFVFGGDIDELPEDGPPTLWDSLMINVFLTAASSFIPDSAPVAARPPAEIVNPERHHVIPVYVCGGKTQKEMPRLARSDHKQLHRELYKFKTAVNIAGKTFSLVFQKRSKRTKKTPIQRLGRSRQGRGAIATGLGIFYSKFNWIDEGQPSIGYALAREAPKFMNKNHSWPRCSR